MFRYLLYLWAGAFLMVSCNKQAGGDLTDFVDPMIGTDGTGNTFPGPSMPFGMVQLSPDTYNEGCCAGYHYVNDRILGFSHTHLSGTGCADFGDILLLPFTGSNPAGENGAKGSRFQHANEKASPGYYSVILDDFNIKAELTATNRVGFHRYTYPENKPASILLDLEHDISGNGDQPLTDCFLKAISQYEVEGLRHSRGWAPDQYVYFVARFSEPFAEKFGELNGPEIRQILTFQPKNGKPVMVKVALSAVSVDGARKNLEEELSGWDFDGTVKEARHAWEKELSKIRIEGGSADQQKIFYTSLYHALLTPNLYSDTDGRYRGMDHQVHQGEGFNYYHVYSLWDTYRAVHPLFNLIEKDRNTDFIRTMLKQYEQSGLLPVWELAGCENNCMIGYHAVSVIADAWLKGDRGFDGNSALEAMLASGSQSIEGIAQYRKYQFIPREMSTNSVSKVLEYAYDDWCIAQMARSLKNDSVYKEYIVRSQFYRNQYDPATGLMRPRYADGRWLEPFDPFKVSMLDQGDYTEANSWHYSFYVPQNVPDLIRLSGGDQPFIAKLDSFFTVQTKNRHSISDFEGIFGQYAHGNEPSHHMPYLYNYAGAPGKSQEILQRAMDEFYTTTPKGLCGNDDCGQLSAWYVFSSMGFYPVCPGSDEYVIGSPMFDKVTISLSNGKTFVIKGKGERSKEKVIVSATLNGKDHPQSFLKYSDMIKGGEITFSFGSDRNNSWGADPANRPSALPIEAENDLKPLGTGRLFMPSIDYNNVWFRRSMMIKMGCLSEGVEIHYTLNGADPTITSPVYDKPFEIDRSVKLRAKAFKPGFGESETATVNFYESSLDPKSPMTRVEYLAPPFGKDYAGKETDGMFAANYNAGGKMALLDGKTGSADYTDGRWQGFEGKDMEVIIDLGRTMPVFRITAGFLQSLAVWIFHPVQVSFSISMDGKEFRMMEVIDNYPDRSTMTDGVRYFSTLVLGNKARYVKVKAQSIGLCPGWHHGAGNKAWLFADEIIVE
jgi:predicted alpha-1,2-mannosidase